MKDDYNPFDEENVSRRKKRFTLVIAFVIASCIAFYVFHAYDVFPKEKEQETLTDNIDVFFTNHTATDNDYDIVIRFRCNSTWHVLNSSWNNSLKLLSVSKWKPITNVDIKAWWC